MRGGLSWTSGGRLAIVGLAAALLALALAAVCLSPFAFASTGTDAARDPATISQRELSAQHPPLAGGRGEGPAAAGPAVGDDPPLSALPSSAPGQEADRQEERERRVRYSRTKLALALGAEVWSWLVLATLLLTGLSAGMRDLSCRALPRGRGSLAVYVLLFLFVTWLLAQPAAYYSGFVVEHQYGLSTQTLPGWLADQVKGLALHAAVGMPVVAVLYWTIRRWPRRWWLGVAGLFVLLSVVAASLYPVLVAPMFNSYKPVEDRALVERIESMASKVDVKVAEVLEEDTSLRTVKANAYFVGIGPTRRIVLTDNLLRQFSSEEVASVVAHELGHQVHNDIWKAIAVGGVFYLAGAYLLYRLVEPIVGRFRRRLRFDRVDDVASLPLLVLLFGILSFTAMPALNGYSRMVEHQADLFALELTRDSDSFVSAMEKLGEINLSDPDPPRVLEVLFYTHPPIRDRVEFARRFEETWESGGTGTRLPAPPSPLLRVQTTPAAPRSAPARPAPPPP